MPIRDLDNRYEGILNVAKPVGLTSHDVVDRVRHIVGMRRVGHAGTLDPAAEGVLLVCLGAATRVCDFLMDGVKIYRATIRFGATSTTDDREGVIAATYLLPSISSTDIQAAASQFIGDIDQVPPTFAAIKVGGQRLYERARAGETVAVPPRRVHVDRLDVLSWNPPDALVEVECSKGTYIRAIARDLGSSLATGAYLTSLCRRSSGQFTLADSHSLDDIAWSATAGFFDRVLVPLDEAVNTWPAVVLSDHEIGRVLHGASLDGPAEHFPQGHDTRVRAYNTGGRFVAILARRGDSPSWYPDKVFSSGEGNGLA